MAAFQHLDLDFGARRRRYPPAGLALLLAGCLLALHVMSIAAGSYRDWQLAKDEKETIEARLAQVRGIAGGTRISAAQQQELRRAEHVIEQLRTPWPTLLMLLESVPMKNVALLAIEPGSSPRNVRITAEAKDIDAMLGYLDLMQAQPGLSGVSLLSHQLMCQTPGTPLRFQLQARWQQPQPGQPAEKATVRAGVSRLASRSDQ